MKKNYFVTAVLSLLCLGASAQKMQYQQNKLADNAKVSTLSKSFVQTEARFKKFGDANFLAKAPISYNDISDGSALSVWRSASGYYVNSSNQLDNYEIVNNWDAFVLGADGESIYWYNPIGSAATATFVKGSMDTENGDITFEFPQDIYAASSGTWTINRMNIDWNTGDVSVNSTNNKIVFHLTDGNKYVADLDGENEMIGMVSPKGWTGYGDMTVSLAFLTDEAPVVPETLAWEDYSVTGTEYDDTTPRSPLMVKAAFEGDKVYVDFTEALGVEDDQVVMVGNVSGDKVVFADGQFLGGENYGQLYYLLAATPEVQGQNVYVTATDKDLVFHLDANAKTLTGASDALVISAANDVMFPMEYMFNPEIKPFAEVAATPANPEFVDYMPYDDNQQYGGIAYRIPDVGTNGEVLLTDKLYYNVFFNGSEEPETLFADEYGIAEDMTNIPYAYADGGYAVADGNGYKVFFFLSDIETIGLQSTYTGAGETHKSKLVWLNLTDGTVDAINGVSASEEKATATEYYNLAGQRIAKPAKGMYIKTTRFADGSQKSVKTVK